MTHAKETVQELLALADVEINGHRPWDIQVHDDRLYARVLATSNLGLGEGYMDGWWDAERIDQFIYKVLSAGLRDKLKPWKLVFPYVKARVLNEQRRSKAFEIGEVHYDVGNDLYTRMLDKRMTYTCGYWQGLEQVPENLDAAQEAKLDLTCRKVGLEKGMRVLDIGCGWGSFAKFAAEKYGVEVVGLTVSKEQVELGSQRCRGLPVELRLQDYRDIRGERFDRVVSLGMFEHVGYKNYRTYMDVVRNMLVDDGLFLLHTIGSNKTAHNNNPWIEKYIFPNSMLPSAHQITGAIEGRFVMEDWHNFSAHYDPTLMAWYHNFDSAWNEIQHQYSDRFYRMWKYYLLSCAGLFRARGAQLWQVVLSKRGVAGGYTSVR